MYYIIYPPKKKPLLRKKTGFFDFFYEIYVKFAFTYPFFDISKLHKPEKSVPLEFRHFFGPAIYIKGMKNPTAIKPLSEIFNR